MHATYRQILLGSQLRTLRAGDLRLTEASYPPNTRFGSHAHETGNISLILCGQIEETVGGSSQVCTTFSVVVKPAGTVHSNRFGPLGARTLVLEIPVDPSLPRWHWFHGGAIPAAALRVYSAFRTHCAHNDDTLEDRVSELLGAVQDTINCATKPTAPPWIEHVREYLHDRFRKRVSVRDVALEFDVHPVYLTRAFRARFGCAITDYLQRLRVRDAADRLASSGVPIAQVALGCGFADQAHLCRLFKRDTGVTPGHFRRLVRGN